MFTFQRLFKRKAAGCTKKRYSLLLSRLITKCVKLHTIQKARDHSSGAEEECRLIAVNRQVTLKTDLKDIIQVFVYSNLNIIVSPNPLPQLPPGTRAVLEAYINYLPGGFGFPSDIQEILNAFILTNINNISMQPQISTASGG